MRFRLGALVALGVAALVAGCGGGGGGDRLSKEEYIAKADAICKEADDKITALGEPQSFEELANLASEAVTIGEEELSALRALQPPEADEATLNSAYELIGRQLEIAGQIAAAAKEGDQAKIQELIDQATPLQDEARKIAEDYGLTECGSEG
jgi:hypothetical protein